MKENRMSVFEKISRNDRAFVICEIGSNHNGDFDLALRHMDIAQKAGADAVKFQSFLADHLLPRHDPAYEMHKKLELPQSWYPKLQKEATDRGMYFFSTATNEITLRWLDEVGVELFKVASPNLTHLPLIRNVAALGKMVIMSTGMATLEEIDEAVRAYTGSGNSQLALLHCVSQYPADPKNLRLKNIQGLQSVFPYPVGFSDHSLEIGTAIAAVALGARIIEKHMTLDRSMKGPDHHYSLEPADFISMVSNIRQVELALGTTERIIGEQEKKKSENMRRSIHAASDLPAGTVLSKEHISIIRPNNGLHTRHYEAVLGMTLSKPLKAQDPITWEAFKDKSHV
jgi:sialic acid synthase SpsE